MTQQEEFLDSAVFRDRIQRVSHAAADAGLTAVVVGTGAELQFLTGSTISSHERLTALVIPALRQGVGDKATTVAGGKAVLIAPEVERGDIVGTTLEHLDLTIELWQDGTNPYEIVANAVTPGIVHSANVQADSTAPTTIAVGESLPALHLLPILKACNAEAVLTTEVLREIFMAKDATELAQLRKAGAAIDRVFDHVPELLQPGKTERDVAEKLHALILEYGHASVDFVIVGSGANGANPHHSYSDRVLETGDVVVVDIGGTLPSGYHSDCTRTFVVSGNANLDGSETPYLQQAREVWEVLRRAQEAGAAAVQPGVTAGEIDAIVRTVVEDAGYGEFFIHRTGHGIGLSVHEEPFIMAGNQLELVPGMAFSIEPGIYLPGKFGMRLENIVAVTDSGCESFNNQPHDLL